MTNATEQAPALQTLRESYGEFHALLTAPYADDVGLIHQVKQLRSDVEALQNIVGLLLEALADQEGAE